MDIEAFFLPDLALPALILVTLTGIVLLTGRQWRAMLIALVIQYLGVFFLLALSWPLEMAIAKLFSGWISCALLGLVMSNDPTIRLAEERFSPSGVVFRLLAGGLVILSVFSLGPSFAEWLPDVPLEIVWGALALMGLGLLHLGLSGQVMRVVVSLLTVFAGFTILYAAVEASTMVAGLMAGVDLGLSIVGIYLLTAPGMEETG